MSERENIQQVASRLVGLRDALELTPEQVADACGIEVETYRNYESGDSTFPLVLFKISLPSMVCRCLNCCSAHRHA